MDTANENRFFGNVCQALAAEEAELHQSIHGIGCLYETTLVYLVWKQLMRDGFPLEVSWEHPYPEDPALHADMALLAEDRQVDCLVEYKLWTSEDAGEVRGDGEKYRKCSFRGGKYLLILERYGGDIDVNTAYLLETFPDVSLVKRATMDSGVYDSRKQLAATRKIHIYMLRMNA